jgi:TonB family protein
MQSSRLVSASLIIAFALLPLDLYSANEVERRLRDEYGGKFLLLRNFYRGDSLRYDISGQILKTALSGDWTVDGLVQVEDLKASNSRLTIYARRLHLGWLAGSFSDVQGAKDQKSPEDESARHLRIEVDFSPGQVTADDAKTALAKVFLTSQDRFAELVPTYWEPCVLAALSGKDSQKYNGCHFSKAFLGVPGVAYSPENASNLEAPVPKSAQEVFHIGQGVTRPKPLKTPDPEFGPEARRAGYQGVVTLLFLVNTAGDVSNVRILSPLGCGLDRRAVERVAGWKFSPATKDGEPVAVELTAEVDFHLH